MERRAKLAIQVRKIGSGLTPDLGEHLFDLVSRRAEQPSLGQLEKYGHLEVVET